MQRFLIFFLFFLFPLQLFAAVPQATREYLSHAGDDAWVVMGRAALGDAVMTVPIVQDSVFALAKSVLALAATGRDARSVNGKDLVDVFLKQYVTQHQIGSVAQVNDDFWGVMALRAAGVSATHSAITDSRSFILRAQQSNGGWSWGATDGVTDTDDTAAAIMALLEADVLPHDPVIARAIAYLRSVQNTDGGLPNTPPGPSSVDSTAWGAMALAKAGEDATRMRSFVESRMLPDGTWGNPATTASAAIALSGKWFPVVFSIALGASPSGDTLPRRGSQSVSAREPSVNALPEFPQPSSRAPFASDLTALPSTRPLLSAEGNAPHATVPIFVSPFLPLAATSVFSKSEKTMVAHAAIDSDGDGYPDEIEIANGYDPHDARPMKKKVVKPIIKKKNAKSKNHR